MRPTSTHLNPESHPRQGRVWKLHPTAQQAATSPTLLRSTWNEAGVTQKKSSSSLMFTFIKHWFSLHTKLVFETTWLCQSAFAATDFILSKSVFPMKIQCSHEWAMSVKHPLTRLSVCKMNIKFFYDVKRIIWLNILLKFACFNSLFYTCLLEYFASHPAFHFRWRVISAHVHGSYNYRF